MDFGRAQIRTQIDARFSPFGHPTQVDTSWSQVNCNYGFLRLANPLVHPDLKSVRKFWYCRKTCIDFGWAQIRTQFDVSFSPFGHQRKSTQVDHKSSLYAWNVRFVTCGPTCDSVWPPIASPYPSSGFAFLRWLAPTCDSVWPGLKVSFFILQVFDMLMNGSELIRKVAENTTLFRTKMTEAGFTVSVSRTDVRLWCIHHIFDCRTDVRLWRIHHIFDCRTDVWLSRIHHIFDSD